MKLNDAVFGLLFMLLGAAVLVAIQGYPKIPGQPVGPALFPGLIASGLCVTGVLLVLKGLRERSEQPWLAWDDWVRSPRYVRAFAVVIGVNVLYIAFVESLGFVIASVLYLGATFAVFRVRARLVVPLAIVVTLIIHYVFYKLLRVPLPWGLLQGVAW